MNAGRNETDLISAPATISPTNSVVNSFLLTAGTGNTVRSGRAFVPSALLAAAVVSLLGLRIFAQDKPPAPPAKPAQTPSQPAGEQTQQPKPVFRTGADLVRVDVAVLDKRGVPVTNLTADDFELTEDGDRQEIRSFQYVVSDGLPNADDEVSLTIRSRSHAAVEAAKDNVRVFLIFWDEYHIGQLASATRARASLMRFVRTAFGPTDIVAFMDPLTPIDSLWFTRDRLELAEHVRKLIGRSGVYLPPRSVVEEAHLERGDIERVRSEVTVSAVKAAAVHLGGMRDGRKSIILISEGLRGMMRDGQTLITDLVRSANDNNTAIFNIDPRGFGPARFSSLFEGVADETGGQYFRSNDLEDALRQVVKQSSGYYLLGYSGSERPMDGRFHKIKVKVKPSGLEVRARAGYVAPSVGDIARAKAKAAESVVPVEVQTALSDLPSPTARRAIDLWLGTTIENGRPTVRIAWQKRAAPVGAVATFAAPAEVSVLGRLGEKRVFEGPVPATGAVFETPPGTVRLTISVEDAAGEVIDRDVRTVEIPDPAKAALWISSPSVLRAQNAREFRTLDRGPSAAPFAGREFLRTDRLVVRFGVHGTAAAASQVTAKIVSQWGKDLSELPLTRLSPDAGDYELDLPLTSVARGDFLLSFTAQAGPEATRAFVPIRVLR
jgi:VWFA-related protein